MKYRINFFVILLAGFAWALILGLVIFFGFAIYWSFEHESGISLRLILILLEVVLILNLIVIPKTTAKHLYSVRINLDERIILIYYPLVGKTIRVYFDDVKGYSKSNKMIAPIIGEQNRNGLTFYLKDNKAIDLLEYRVLDFKELIADIDKLNFIFFGYEPFVLNFYGNRTNYQF